MKIKKNEPRSVDAAVIKVYAKPCDSGSYTLVDVDGNTIADHDGYVPSFFPGEHYGDYLILEINLESGRILNWKKPTKEAIEKFIEEAKP